MIGTTADGTAAKANGSGVIIVGSPNNTVGGTTSVFRNIISGNTGAGISISGTGATGNSVQGNLIGIAVGGVTAIPNNVGIVISGVASNTVGGAVVAARNVISGNTTFGIQITASGASNNTVLGNFIGVNATGNGAVPNDVGVQIDTAAASNTVGGSSSAIRNVISGNITANVQIIASINNQIVFNTIGLNSDGTAAINVTQASKAGIELEDGATGNTIGGITGSATTANNVISASAGPNIQIRGKTNATVTATASNNVIQGNFIGTNLAGTAAASTTTGGGGIVLTDGTTGNTVGGTGSFVRNVISGNIGVGISLLAAGTSSNLIQGNLIGVQTDTAQTALGNTGNGVFVDGATNNTVGGSATNAANTIANNGGAGVYVNTGTGIAISQNSIFGNTGLGIDLAPTGVNPNSATQPGVGPNNLQNYPSITGVTTSNTASGTASGVTTIAGTLQSAASTTYTVELFSNVVADASGHGQGKTFLKSITVITDATGKGTFSTTTPTALTSGTIVSATATDGSGNTSEFSANATNTTATADLVLTLVGKPDPVAATGFLTYTMVITNNGPSTALNTVVKNTLPTGVSFIGATSTTGSITQSGSTVTATVGDLANGASATMVITVVAPSTSTTTLTDNAVATTDTFDPNNANNSASVKSTVQQGPDLVVTTTVTPATTSIGVPATITYTVTNVSTTNSATNVNLTAPLSSSLTGLASSVTQGSSTTTGGTLTAAFGTLAVGASATVTLMVTPTAAGTILTTATVTSDAPDVNPSTNAATSTLTVSATPVTPVTGDGPRVVGLDRSGFHTQTSKITLTFSGTLDQPSATSLANYHLVAAGKDGKFGTKDDRTLRLKSAFYDNVARTVVVSTKKPYSLHQNVQLTAVGSVSTGIKGTSGLLLDGANTGEPGSDFVKEFNYVGPGRLSITSVGAAFARRRAASFRAHKK